MTEVCSVLRQPLFTWTVLGLTSLYFVCTGIQFWATDYFITVLHGDKETVMILFVLASATGPIGGVMFGGWFVDYCGGYKGPKQRMRALSITLAFGVLANISAALAAFLQSLIAVMVWSWILLFFGGACLPALTGIYIDAVATHLKALASSLSQICMNLLGYALSPLLSGWLMSLFEAKLPACHDTEAGHCPAAFTWGFRIVLLWSQAALMLQIAAWFHAWRASRGNDSTALGGDPQGDAPASPPAEYSLFDKTSEPGSPTHRHSIAGYVRHVTRSSRPFDSDECLVQAS